MAYILPSTVEELNFEQNRIEFNPTLYERSFEKDFNNIPIEKQYKREYSLPNGVDWNIRNFDPYLNFEDNLPSELKVIGSLEDRRVPEEGDPRQRCESFSSVASSMDEKPMQFQSFGVKTFNTVRMDSGSTCISSEHTYAHTSSANFRGLDVEETYQNLDLFLQQVPDINMNDNIPSPLSSNDSNFELSTLSSFSCDDTTPSLPEPTTSLKRPADLTSEDDVFISKMTKIETPLQCNEVRKKNNIASKNCRKTRKEKQKEMETRVAELEKEREELNYQVKVLEEFINAHKVQLYSILQKR